MRLQTLTIYIAILNLYGCTVNLPPTESQIPAADPIIINPASKASEQNQTTTQPTELPPTPSVTSPTVTKAAGKSTGDRQGHLYYVVKPKDTVFEVMRQTGVSWKEIIKLNNLKAPDYKIYPGQSLRIK